MPRLILAFVFACMIVIASSRGDTEPIITTDLLRIRHVTAIDVSREGSRAVFAVRSIATIHPPTNAEKPNELKPHVEPTYKYQSHLFLLELGDPNAAPRQITFGDRNDGAPKFSPDGKQIVFVRDITPEPSTGLSDHQNQHATASAQVWIIAVDGGEAQQITRFKHGCSSAQWSPDGGRLLVSSPVPMHEIEGTPPWPMERPKRTWKDAPHDDDAARPDGTREQIRAWLERNAHALNPNVINRIEFQDETKLHGLMRLTQLYLVDPLSPALPIEQSVATQITKSFSSHEQAVFMPDGQSIVYTSKKSATQHLDRVLPTSIWRINIDGSGDRAILSLDGWSFESPKPARDGASIAFLGQRMDEPAFRQTQLGIAAMKPDAASDPVWVTDEGTFAGSVREFEWIQAQPGLVFTAPMRGGYSLLTINPGLVQPATLVSEADGRPVGVHAFAAGGGSIVYSVTSANNPCVLMVRDGRGMRVAMDLNPWAANKNISLPRVGEISRPDGVKVQYWVMEPTNREPGKKYPLVLQMHGGPSAMWGPGEFTMWHEFQLLCSWGFGVVYANPRGSGGYGYAFQRGNFQDWGEGPAGDVLAAVDQALLSNDWVDAERLVITGGSYAGYLTAWVISHDNRFKAAVAQRGVYDFETFFGEGNAWRLIAWAMGGPPTDARFKPILERNNPMNFVNRIKTPLLIMHSSSDLRTGVSQSEMLYRALKELNRPVEYVRYPNEGHDLSRTGDPKRRMDRLNRIIEWFERFVENPRPAPVASSSQ